MFGDVITVKTRRVAGLHEGETVVIELAERRAAAIDVIENTDFHDDGRLP